MLLSEVFNTQYPWNYTENGNTEFAAEFRVDGDVRYEVYGYDKGMIHPEWYLGFSRNVPGDPHSVFDLTGTGDSQKIFATVINIFKSFFNDHPEYIHRIYFEAKEPSRRSLYLKLIKKLLPTWKTSVERNTISAYNPKDPH